MQWYQSAITRHGVPVARQPPHQYLQALRLNGLRRALRDPAGPGSVQEAAARWGFWHLSACAAEYKRMFGELPSMTLRARTQGAPQA